MDLRGTLNVNRIRSHVAGGNTSLITILYPSNAVLVINTKVGFSIVQGKVGGLGLS